MRLTEVKAAGLEQAEQSLVVRDLEIHKEIHKETRKETHKACSVDMWTVKFASPIRALEDSQST